MTPDEVEASIRALAAECEAEEVARLNRRRPPAQTDLIEALAEVEASIRAATEHVQYALDRASSAYQISAASIVAGLVC